LLPDPQLHSASGSVMLISASAFLQIRRYTPGLLGVCHGMQPG